MTSRGRIRGRTGTPKKEYHTKRLEMRFVEVDYVVQANSTNEAEKYINNSPDQYVVNVTLKKLVNITDVIQDISALVKRRIQ